MELRPLGRTGIDVSILGLGTVKLGRDRAVKYPTPVVIPDDDEARRLLDTARDLGINLIDTAPAYALAEQRLGTLLAGDRDQWVIVTKAGEEFDGTASRFDFSEDAIRASVERSLGRLRTDRIDVVLLHSDGNAERDLASGAALEALRTLKEQGKIRAIGVSTKTVEGSLRAIETCDVIMVTLRPGDEGESGVVGGAHARGVGVLVKKVFASGHLDRVGAPPGTDPVEHALRHALLSPGVSSVVVGTADDSHLRANAAAAGRALRSP